MEEALMWANAPKWISGLRANLESIWGDVRPPAVIVGHGRISGEFADVLEVKVSYGKSPGENVEINGMEFTFSYPVLEEKDFDDVYYSIVSLLSVL